MCSHKIITCQLNIYNSRYTKRIQRDSMKKNFVCWQKQNVDRTMFLVENFSLLFSNIAEVNFTIPRTMVCSVSIQCFASHILQNKWKQRDGYKVEKYLHCTKWSEIHKENQKIVYTWILILIFFILVFFVPHPKSY